MILIAESGSTKTDWSLVKSRTEQTTFLSNGMNPYFHTAGSLHELLSNELPRELLDKDIDALYFYGAGCSSEQRVKRVEEALKHFFPKTYIEVNHDLLASARALCGDEPGIATILGTGSNACVYDGKAIIRQSGGIGFILGDEGSGADLGKRFLKAYFYGELPNKVQEAFENQQKPDKDNIVDRVYRQPQPNKYLASYAKFINEHRDNPYINQMIKHSFREFIERHLLKFDERHEWPLHSVGSVAYYFEAVIQEVLGEYGLKLDRLIVKPIDHLIEYHMEWALTYNLNFNFQSYCAKQIQ